MNRRHFYFLIFIIFINLSERSYSQTAYCCCDMKKVCQPVLGCHWKAVQCLSGDSQQCCTHPEHSSPNTDWFTCRRVSRAGNINTDVCQNSAIKSKRSS